MPQIAQLAATYASQIFWMLVVFVLIYGAIGRGMLPRITATVDAREQRIAGDLAAAEAARAAADTTEAAYHRRLDAARADAQAEAAAAKAAATRETEARLRAGDAAAAARTAEAEAQLATARREASGHVEAVAAEAARDIVTRLAGIEVPPEQAGAAARAALAAA